MKVGVLGSGDVAKALAALHEPLSDRELAALAQGGAPIQLGQRLPGF